MVSPSSRTSGSKDVGNPPFALNSTVYSGMTMGSLETELLLVDDTLDEELETIALDETLLSLEELLALDTLLEVVSLDDAGIDDDDVWDDDTLTEEGLESRMASASVLSALAIIDPTTTAEIAIDNTLTMVRTPCVVNFCICISSYAWSTCDLISTPPPRILNVIKTIIQGNPDAERLGGFGF
jgi:hypothetical protein